MTVQAKTDPQARLVKAMAHPLRHRILIRLNEAAASPSVLARELEEPLGNVAYHVKILLEHDAIELVETKPVRGAIEHVYRATTRPFFDDQQWSQVPLSLRQDVTQGTLQRLLDDLTAAGRAGELDGPGTQVSWTALELDRQGYEEVAELLAQTLERAAAIETESAGRLKDRSDGEREHAALGLLHYRRAARER